MYVGFTLLLIYDIGYDIGNKEDKEGEKKEKKKNWRFALMLQRYAQNLSKMALLSSDSFLCQACGIHEDLISERMWLDVRRIGLGPVSRVKILACRYVARTSNEPVKCSSRERENKQRSPRRSSHLERERKGTLAYPSSPLFSFTQGILSSILFPFGRVNGTAKDSNNDGGRISSGISVSIRCGIIYQETPNNYCCLAHILYMRHSRACCRTATFLVPSIVKVLDFNSEGSVRRPIEDSDDGVRLTVPLTPRSSSSSSLLALRWRDQPRNQYDFEEIESGFNKISIRGNGLKWRYHVQRAADTKAAGRFVTVRVQHIILTLKEVSKNNNDCKVLLLVVVVVVVVVVIVELNHILICDFRRECNSLGGLEKH
ncbi:hypothetical protein V1477_020385 [Vespula maculifrons]|uniref:Uncharacterized protein n=1 Tax=Vespula maculifrons TaxID=7453 RepID=A0ABD2APJ1_VESMC